MEHFSVDEFNRRQSYKQFIRLSETDKPPFILENEKPIAVVHSCGRYERLLAEGVDSNEY